MGKDYNLKENLVWLLGFLGVHNEIRLKKTREEFFYNLYSSFERWIVRLRGPECG